MRENNSFIEREKDNKFSSYESAVEKSSWVRKAAAKVSFGGGKLSVLNHDLNCLREEKCIHCFIISFSFTII